MTDQPTTTIQEEPLAPIIDQVDALGARYWAEVCPFGHLAPYAGDRARYQALADQGVLQLVTVRQGDRVVGFHMSLLFDDPHSQGLRCAMGDTWYLAPEARQAHTGSRLLRVVEEGLRAKGVHVFLATTTLAHDVDVLYRRRGYTPIERVYMKQLDFATGDRA